MPAWRVDRTDEGSTVVPINDVIAHEDTDCPCLPTIEYIPCEDGPDGWMTVHHAWDGRE